jgi:hypothetical protein
LTDPSPATTFLHLDSTVVLSRDIASLGIYPAVDPLDSTSRQLDPQVVGEEHYAVARAVQMTLQRYKELRDIIAILGMDELSPEDKLPCPALARSSVSCPSRSTWLKSLPVPRASSFPEGNHQGLQGHLCWRIRSPAGTSVLHGRRYRGSHRKGQDPAVMQSLHRSH